MGRAVIWQKFTVWNCSELISRTLSGTWGRIFTVYLTEHPWMFCYHETFHECFYLLLSFWKKQQNLQNVSPPCFAFIGFFGWNIFNEVSYRMRHLSPDTGWTMKLRFFILSEENDFFWLKLYLFTRLCEKVFKVKLLNEIDMHKHFKLLSVNK